MDTDQRSGSPVLRPKLDRPQGRSVEMGQLIRISAAAAVAVGAVGVLIAAAVPSIDLFGVYSWRDASAAAKPANPKSGSPVPPPAPAPATAPPAPAPAPPASSSSAELNPTPTDSQPASEDPDAVDGEATSAPPATEASKTPVPAKPPERSKERDIALVRDLPPAVDLPAVTDVGDTTLAYLHEAERIALDDVRLLTEVAVLGDDQSLLIQRDGEKPRWLIRFRGPPQLARADSGGDALDHAADKRGADKRGAENTAPDGTVAEDSVAENTAPDGTVAKDSVAEDSVAEDSVAEDSVAEDRVAASAATNDGGGDQNAPPVDVVLAELWCVQSSLMFRWHEAARDVPAAEQLRNAAVQFAIASHRQTMALRAPLAQPSHVVDLAERWNEIAAPVAHPPRAESLRLEISGARDMSVNASYEHDRQVVPIEFGELSEAEKKRLRPTPPRRAPPRSAISAPADQPGEELDEAAAARRLTILFDTFEGGVRPQLWIEPRHGGAGDVTIRVGGRIVHGRTAVDLTVKSLEAYRVPRQQALASVERDWKNAHDAIVFLDRRIGETRAGISSGTSVRALQAQLQAAQRAYKQLDDQLKRLKTELAWSEAAQRLVQTIDKHARLKYRVFSKSGDLEIDLVRGGLD